jgi:malonyl-CoA O-methyltransferase
MGGAAAAFVDRRQVCRNFTRIAAGYAAADVLAREVDRRMQERLDYVRITPQRIIDLGCGPGVSLGELQKRYPAAQAFGVDLVPAMLPRPAGWRRFLPGTARTPFYGAADAARLPLAAATSGLVWSNLLLPWIDDPLPVLQEAARILEVGGLLMFSTLGPDSLKELRTSFRDGYSHTQRFVDMHDLGDMLVACGFADPVMDQETLTLTYATLPELFADLRASGAACAMQDRRRGLMGRAVWQGACAAYEEKRRDGRLPMSCEIVYGHAWKGVPKTLEDGRSIVRFMPAPSR